MEPRAAPQIRENRCCCTPVNTSNTPRSALRVGTFNIHNGKGTDDKRDLQRTADCVRDLDFVALQEVRGSVVGLPQVQAGVLRHALQRAWIFAPPQRAKWHERFGNAFDNGASDPPRLRAELEIAPGGKKAGFEFALRCAGPLPEQRADQKAPADTKESIHDAYA